MEELVWTKIDLCNSVTQFFTNPYTKDRYLLVHTTSSKYEKPKITYSIIMCRDKGYRSYKGGANNLEDALDLLTRLVLTP